MKIAIIGAMKEEISEITARATISKKHTIAGFLFYEGTIDSIEVVIVQTGIGKVNAAAATQILVDRFSPTLIVFTGLAGSANHQIKIGDFVIAKSLVYHDFDLTHFGREKGFVPNVGKYIPSDENISYLLKKACDQLRDEKQFPPSHFGIIASGDLFVAQKDKIVSIAKEFSADAVEMEGAAVAHVATLNKVPFAVIRTISDSADENALSDFKSFLEKAAIREWDILKRFISLLRGSL